MALGKKLHNLRIAKNLTKEGVALELGVSKTAYGKWENDIAKPNFQNISTICNFYNISKDELMEEEKNINQNNNTFNNSPNVINSPNPTFNYTISDEIIQKITDNQNNISELVQNQNILLQKILQQK
ncbi:helix-turn-helix domain-containing protein [Amniculibacterium aquaticum]|uniref:helix-turn-helix domain-containing protein n=1 Tax=Amniculibacterium aquaticum TaxID=2479858 RepID=UPI000F5AE5A8|nr:helix-turn-helix transcriptional regulator [Amniculibacterium aquaticum]